MKEIKLFVRKEFVLLFLLLILFIDPFQKGFYMCFILAFYLATIETSSISAAIDKYGILLFLFSISYSVIYSTNPDAHIILILGYVIAPITFYAIGKYFWMKYRSINIFYFLFIFLLLGYSLIPAISILYHIIENGFSGTRELKLLTRDVVSGGPLLGSFFTMNMAAAGTIFVQSSNKIESKIKIITLAVFIISLICVFRVASRTQLGIALISLLVTISYLSVKQSFSKNIRLILTLAITSVVVLFSISSDSAVFNILNERNNSEEVLMSGTGRTGLWKMSLDNIFEYPFGWELPSSASGGGGYSHNLWLDVSRVGGIFPFIFLSLFTVLCFFLVIKTLKVAPRSLYFNTIILVLFFGFMAVFFVEPVIEGMFNLFLIFCLLIGIQSGYVETELSVNIKSGNYRYIKFEYSNENSQSII
jgi:hypothetical protein